MSEDQQTSSPKTTNRPQNDDESMNETTQEKQVRFHGRVKRRYVEYIPEWVHENVWYTSKDYAEARKRERVLRECVSVDDELWRKNKDNLNAQGILTEKQALSRDATIEASLLAVLDEQERQESTFYAINEYGPFFLDHETVALLYSCHSQESLEQARLRANCHERHVQKINSTPDEEPSSPFSPSRFMKKYPTLPDKRLVRSGVQIPRPSVFVPEGSSAVSTPAA